MVFFPRFCASGVPLERSRHLSSPPAAYPDLNRGAPPLRGRTKGQNALSLLFSFQLSTVDLFLPTACDVPSPPSLSLSHSLAPNRVASLDCRLALLHVLCAPPQCPLCSAFFPCPPFVFISLRIAFFSTPLFSMPSALPYVFSKSIPKKENHNDPLGL